LKQACHSLAEAHHSGLIHRDIKPANLFTCRLGMDHDFVKVLDFGLVKKVDGMLFEGDENLTQARSTSGTPAYMPPEIATGDQTVDGRADLYALGCVAYYLVTGELVFEGATPMRVIMHHVQTEPVPPSKRTELPVPPDLDRAILLCLEKDPARRPQTAEELASMLGDMSTARAWTGDRSAQWWDTNLPTAAGRPESPRQPEPLADTMS
jgi:serine/threonine-protein kinase